MFNLSLLEYKPTTYQSKDLCLQIRHQCCWLMFYLVLNSLMWNTNNHIVKALTSDTNVSTYTDGSSNVTQKYNSAKLSSIAMMMINNKKYFILLCYIILID